jgi:hypothetical protein
MGSDACAEPFFHIDPLACALAKAAVGRLPSHGIVVRYPDSFEPSRGQGAGAALSNVATVVSGRGDARIDG